MPILLNSTVFIAGVLKGPSDGTLTLGAALESDLVNRRGAVYVGGNPAAGGLVAASFATDIAGNTTIVGGGSRVALNQFERILQKNGVVANVTTDDASNLQAAIVEARAGGNALIFPPDIRSIKLNSGIELMADKDRLEALSTILLDFSGMTSGVAVTVGSTITDQNLGPLYAMPNAMKGFRLVGGAVAGVTAWRFFGASTHAYFYQVKSCTADNFMLTADFYTNTFGIAFQDFAIRPAVGGTALQCLTGGGSNYGERYNFTNGMIYNGLRGVLNTNAASTFNFVNCSLDGLEVVADVQAGRVSFETCHVESTLDGDYMFKLSGNEASTIKMSNIEMNLLSTRTKEIWDISAAVIFGGVFVDNINFSTPGYTAATYVRGDGRASLKNVTYFGSSIKPPMAKSMHRLRPGLDDAASIAEWTLGGTVLPVLDTVNKFAGAGSMYFGPAAGQTTAEVLLKIEPTEQPRASYRYQKAGSSAGQSTFYVVLVWVDSKGTDIRADTIEAIDGNVGWTVGYVNTSFVKPIGAASYRLRFVNGADAAVTGQLWIDELIINHI